MTDNTSYIDMLRKFGSDLGLPKLNVDELLQAQKKNLEALTNMLGLLKNQDPKLALSKLQELRADYPSSADITAQSTKRSTLVRLTLTPRARAAPGLPPVARIQLPALVCVRT